jgi:hypothetical protein
VPTATTITNTVPLTKVMFPVVLMDRMQRTSCLANGELS